MKKFSPEKVNKINRAWVKCNGNALPERLKSLFKIFNQKSLKGIKQKDSPRLLKMEYQVLIRKMEQLSRIMDNHFQKTHMEYILHLREKYDNINDAKKEIDKNKQHWLRLNLYEKMMIETENIY